MTEDQYKKLCKACDEVLLAEDSSFERVAIPWLHVLREHPVFLRQYEDLFVSATFLLDLIRGWQRILFSIAIKFRLCLRILKSRGQFWYGCTHKNVRADFVFISHLLSLSQITLEDDFYFGASPVELTDKGQSTLIVLINHTGVPAIALNRLLKKSPVPRVVISDVLPFKEEFLIGRRISKERDRLRKAFKRETNGLKKKILRRAVVEVNARSTWNSLRISRVVGEIISYFNVKTLVTTYEGHAWERIVYATAREINPEIVCIGYQHAALFRLQHAAKRSVGDRYDPTKILTSGPVGLRQLQRAADLKSVSLGVLGSRRLIRTIRRIDKPMCLVLPEGISQECKILFQFSLECARACPRVHFIWRVHPIIPFTKLIKIIPTLISLPTNVTISEKKFEDDIGRSSWALYRGSTAAISAASNGVQPIYLAQRDELLIDPLYEISECRPMVETVDQFISALKWSKWTKQSEDYCRQFYTPTNSEELILTNLR